MKKLILITTLISLSACSSFNPKVEEMKTADKCVVWKEDRLGIRHKVEPEADSAKQKMTCWVWNMYLCSYNEYKFTSAKSGDIESSVLGSVGKLQGKTMTAELTGTKIEPFDIQKNKATYTSVGPIGPKTTSTVEFNDKCTTRQAAVGILALLAD